MYQAEATDWEFVGDPDRPGAFRVRAGGASQSYVDPADPLHLEFEYMQWIGDVLDIWAPAGQRLRVIHVGGAAMSLARYVTATRPTSAQIVLEPDVALTERVRQVLPLPRNSGIKVRPVDGRAGIVAMPSSYADVIIIDAFIAGRVPAELTTVQCLAQAQRVLRASGVLIINITDRGPTDYSHRVLAGLASCLPHVALIAEPAVLKGRRLGNLVLLAAAAELPIQALQRAGAGAMFPYRVVHGTDLGQRIAGAKPFTDLDSAQSPDLAEGLRLR